MSTPTAIVLDWQCEVTWPALPEDAQTRLSLVIQATLARVALHGTYAVSLVITDDRRMRRVNRAFRGIDKTTDVLSFPQSTVPLLTLPPDEAWVARAIGDDTHARPDPIADDVARAATVSSPALPAVDGVPYHLGDMMLAAPTVQRQAAEAGHSPWWECCFLVAHGTLHLLGYDDYYEPGYRMMVAHQEAILAELGIAREGK
jgi:probable rRNA maturation factor